MYKFKCGDYCVTKVDNRWIKKGRIICIEGIGKDKANNNVYMTNLIDDFYYSEYELEYFM